MNVEEFEVLLKQVEEAYPESGLEDKELYYSLVGTRIRKKQPLIVGLNWGGGSEEDLKIMKEKGEKYEPQTSNSYQKLIDDNTHIFSEGLEIGILRNVEQYVKDYTVGTITEAAHIGWTNFCFFRTPDEKTLPKKAMERSKPIFLKLIETIQPSMIIGFSAKLREYLKEQNMLEQVEEYTAQDENC